MEGNAECAVVGCTNVRMWRQQCEKHARRLLAGEPLHDPPAGPPPPTPIACAECGQTWDRPHGSDARYCSDPCRFAHTRRRPPSPNLARDAEIAAAVARGELHRDVAAQYGISAPRVWQIVHGWEKPADARRSPRATPR